MKTYYYTFCFRLFGAVRIRAYSNLADFCKDLNAAIEAIDGGSIDTYKLTATSTNEALRRAEAYYRASGWTM